MRAATIVLLPIALLLGACGQKGDLYIASPEREAVATVPTDATPPTTPEDDDDSREQAQQAQ
jgi:predicted small lipoprotein YifL